jgi:hypothetical protein
MRDKEWGIKPIRSFDKLRIPACQAYLRHVNRQEFH